MSAPPPADPWSARVRAALARYDEPLLRAVAGRLVKPKIGQPADELADPAAATQTNPPVIDRRLRELPENARSLLGLVGLSRRPRWPVNHLMDLAAAAGHPDGFAPVRSLLDAGLMFPDGPEIGRFGTFDDWLGRAGLTAAVFAHPAVLARVRGQRPAATAPTNADVAVVDGLDWPIRLAAAWQQVRALPFRRTQADTLFKRDLARLSADPVLSAPFPDAPEEIPDTGVLAIYWAEAAGLFAPADDGELRAGPFPPAWAAGLWPTLTELFGAFFAVAAWDPLAGYGLNDVATPTAALILFARLADGPADGVPVADLTGWLWEHHPAWAAALPKPAQKLGGRPWVDAFLASVAVPLGVVGVANETARLTAFGRFLLAGGAEPPTPPAFPQTLLVQPNAEVLAYRQGLTPDLIARLSRFAGWSQIGPACTLQLSAEETYRGLEGGLTAAGLTQTLERHGMRPVPAAVADLLRRWADKRDRITVYESATLVEFASPADLDEAVRRGVVEVRLTDRIGLTPAGGEPDFQHLRLIGNRDYESRPQRCIRVGPDGLTLTVDAAQSDLLLEAEIGRLADAVPGESPGVRTYRVSPETLRRASAAGITAEDLDRWFVARTGEPLSPAGKLLVLGPSAAPPTAAEQVVVRFASAELTDGIEQWPATRPFVAARLGPDAVAIVDGQLGAFRNVLAAVGIRVEGEGRA